MLARIGAVSLVLLLTACAGAGSGSEKPSTPSPSGPSLRPASQQPTSTQTAGAGTSVTGVLGADSIEGGCPYLEAAGGTRYEVLYPKGWKIDRSSATLTNPQGDVVARAGATVTVRGAITTDMASTCQIGPIFQATEVVTIDR